MRTPVQRTGPPERLAQHGIEHHRNLRRALSQRREQFPVPPGGPCHHTSCSLDDFNQLSPADRTTAGYTGEPGESC
ncbi:MAG: hypothetical protein ACRDY5_06445 [Acidimicrobiales bacterium]